MKTEESALAKYDTDAGPMLVIPSTCKIGQKGALETVMRSEKARYKALLQISTGLAARLNSGSFRTSAPEGLISNITILKAKVDAHWLAKGKVREVLANPWCVLKNDEDLPRETVTCKVMAERQEAIASSGAGQETSL